MALGGQAVVEDPPGGGRRVAADVVAEQEVGEEQVTTPGEQWFAGAEPHGRFEPDGDAYAAASASGID